MGMESQWMTAGKSEFLRENNLKSLRPPQIPHKYSARLNM